MFYRSLAKKLVGQRALFAIEASGLRIGETPLCSVQEMALRYHADIRRSPIGDKFVLGGFCFGCLVALELAAIYQMNGILLPPLVLIFPSLGRSFMTCDEQEFFSLESARRAIDRLPENRRFSALAFFDRLRDVYAVHARAMKSHTLKRVKCDVRIIIPRDLPDEDFYMMRRQFDAAIFGSIEYVKIDVEKNSAFEDEVALESIFQILKSID